MRHRMLGRAVAALLSGESDFVVVEVVHGCSECPRRVSDLAPDVLLCDMGLGRTDLCKVAGAPAGGGQAPLELFSLARSAVVLHEGSDEWPMFDAVRAGVRGHLTLDSSPESLFRAIRAVQGGEVYVEPSLQSTLMSHLRQADEGRTSAEEPLSRRQREVLLLLSQGKRNQEIAADLLMSVSAVKHHVSAVLARLHASNRTDAVRIAMARGIISQPS